MNRANRKLAARLGGWASLLAAMALVLQLAVPSLAHAANPGTHSVEICTQDGVKTVALELPAAPVDHEDCAKCPVCVVGSIAVLVAPAIAILPAGFAAPHGLGTDLAAAPPPARAPPRPFGQGPPLLDA